nr:hypothetical protein [Ktedonobacter racemifer]
MVKLNQDGVTDFARQGTIGLMLFQAMIDGGVGEIGPLVNEGLPDVVIGLVVQVFRGKGRLVNESKACIMVTDEMSFDQLHLVASSFSNNTSLESMCLTLVL